MLGALSLYLLGESMTAKIYLADGKEPDGDEWLLIQSDAQGGRVEFNGGQRTHFVREGRLWDHWERQGPAVAKSLGLDRGKPQQRAGLDD